MSCAERVEHQWAPMNSACSRRKGTYGSCVDPDAVQRDPASFRAIRDDGLTLRPACRLELPDAIPAVGSAEYFYHAAVGT